MHTQFESVSPYKFMPASGPTLPVLTECMRSQWESLCADLSEAAVG